MKNLPILSPAVTDYINTHVLVDELRDRSILTDELMNADLSPLYTIYTFAFTIVRIILNIPPKSECLLIPVTNDIPDYIATLANHSNPKTNDSITLPQIIPPMFEYEYDKRLHFIDENNVECCCFDADTADSYDYKRFQKTIITTEMNNSYYS
jgi:hypothetical protein